MFRFLLSWLIVDTVILFKCWNNIMEKTKAHLYLKIPNEPYPLIVSHQQWWWHVQMGRGVVIARYLILRFTRCRKSDSWTRRQSKELENFPVFWSVNSRPLADSYKSISVQIIAPIISQFQFYYVTFEIVWVIISSWRASSSLTCMH